MAKHYFEFMYDDTTGEFSVVNKETGEVKAAKKPVSKKVEESSEPMLILQDTKYSLNSAAVELLGVEPGDKLDIKYEKKGQTIYPVIGKDEDFGTHGGNKLTKSFTVLYRGNKRDELAKYGEEFKIIPHESKVGIFILENPNKVEESQEEELSFSDLDDLQDLIDNPNVEDVPSSIFSL